MRSLGLTLMVAGAIGFGVLGIGIGVQAVALPAPSEGELAAAHAISVLRQYRRVVSTLRLGSGRTLRASCRDGWFPRRGTLLLMSNGVRVLDYRHARLTNRAVAELELAGCPRVLDSRLKRLIEGGADVHVSMRGRMIAVRFDTGRLPLTLYLRPHGDRPLGVGIGPYLSRLRLGCSQITATERLGRCS